MEHRGDSLAPANLFAGRHGPEHDVIGHHAEVAVVGIDVSLDHGFDAVRGHAGLLGEWKIRIWAGRRHGGTGRRDCPRRWGWPSLTDVDLLTSRRGMLL